ncbi:MAG: SEC-C domain-containing protein, partial [Methylococcales bacterium]|nr:SEC-C domain-containing protein [Methylococcales bacterium]
LEDDLMRIFASERVARLMQSLGMEEGEAIEHPWVTRAIENAQTKVEGRNFDMRKEILAYDDVANDQRKVIYEHRNELMAAEDINDMISGIREDVVNDVITKYIPAKTMEEQWDISELEEHLLQEYLVDLPLQDMLDKDHSFQETDLRQYVVDALEQSSKDKEEISSPEVMRHFEKSVMLQVLDNSWKEHLAAMDTLRQGIHFRGYAQKDPKQEYKRESFDMFTNLLDHIKYEVIGILAKVQVAKEKDVDAIDEQRQAPQEMHYEHAEANPVQEEPEAQPQLADNQQQAEKPFVRDGKKIGRNDPCPCGSNKKYKQCHGKLT